MKPSVSRMVHYVSHGTPPQVDGTQAYYSECRAAIVTEVCMDGQTLGLCVLNPTGQFFNRGVPQDDGHDTPGSDTGLCGGRSYRGGTWHWPARVD